MQFININTLNLKKKYCQLCSMSGEREGGGGDRRGRSGTGERSWIYIFFLISIICLFRYLFIMSPSIFEIIFGDFSLVISFIASALSRYCNKPIQDTAIE